MSTYLNPNSTQFQLNFDSTSCQPQPQIKLSLNINLNSTSTLTSTQKGCDIKANQSSYKVCGTKKFVRMCSNKGFGNSDSHYFEGTFVPTDIVGTDISTAFLGTPFPPGLWEQLFSHAFLLPQKTWNIIKTGVTKPFLLELLVLTQILSIVCFIKIIHMLIQ